MLERLTNSIRYFIIGKKFIEFIKANGDINEFLYKYDLREEWVSVFDESKPRVLSEMEHTAVCRMYVYIRDVMNEGYGMEKAIRLSSLTEDMLCEIGLVDEECLRYERQTERLLREIVKSELKVPVRFHIFKPASNEITFELGTGERGVAYLDEGISQASIYVGEARPIAYKYAS